MAGTQVGTGEVEGKWVAAGVTTRHTGCMMVGSTEYEASEVTAA